MPWPCGRTRIDDYAPCLAHLSRPAGELPLGIRSWQGGGALLLGRVVHEFLKMLIESNYARRNHPAEVGDELPAGEALRLLRMRQGPGRLSSQLWRDHG